MTATFRFRCDGGWVRRSVILGVAGALAVGAALLSRSVFRAGREGNRVIQARSCSLSIYAALDLYAEAVDELASDVGDSWEILSRAERDALLRRFSSYRYDCQRVTTEQGDVWVDPWGQPLNIAWRRPPAGKLCTLVWSSGADGVSGTPDDVVWPPDAPIPQRDK
jgi:hypothetical protein